MESSDYSVQVRLDGAVIHEQPLDDPFVTTKTVLVAGWWCCLAGLFLRRFRTFKLVFSVEASPSALLRGLAGADYDRERQAGIPLEFVSNDFDRERLSHTGYHYPMPEGVSGTLLTYGSDSASNTMLGARNAMPLNIDQALAILSDAEQAVDAEQAGTCRTAGRRSPLPGDDDWYDDAIKQLHAAADDQALRILYDVEQLHAAGAD